MFLIVGLGNPGRKYDRTRHNLGFWVVDQLAGMWGITDARTQHDAVTGTGTCGSEKVILAKPQTFMNRSGQAVQALCAFYKLDPADSLVVVVDDLALPVGKIRIRPSGSPGSHNGLKDISSRLGTDQYTRVRVGIGASPIADTAAYVLAKMNEDEAAELSAAADVAAKAVDCIVLHGIDTAMNQYNRSADDTDASARAEN